MSSNQNITEQDSAVRAAAAWWAEAVRAPRFDNGDETGMSGFLATLVAAKQPDANPEQRASFADLLAARFQAQLDAYTASSGFRYISVGVDYGPDPLLAGAAREAGISTSKFPWKTNMWIYPDYVTVSAGYGAADKLVWASDEWMANRPACERQQWDDSRTDYATYGGEPFVCSSPKYHDGPHNFDQRIELCATCGRPDGWYHNAAERDHMADFHEFAAAVQS